jgi:MFS family permease
LALKILILPAYTYSFTKHHCMNIKSRLVVMNFLEFFVWGSWLISLGAYLFNTLRFEGWQVGDIYGTMGVASLFMPALLGIVADRWVNAERVLGLCHIIGAGLLLYANYSIEQHRVLYYFGRKRLQYRKRFSTDQGMGYRWLHRCHVDG